MSCCGLVWSADRRKSLPAWRGAIPPGALVYAKRDHVGRLFPQLAGSRSRIVLVTAESDDPVGLSDAKDRPPQVFEWFSANACDPWFTSIPLGLGNSYCPVTSKAADIAEVVRHSPKRTRLLSVNFRQETNPRARKPLMDFFVHTARSANWLTVRQGGLSAAECLAETASHRFVLCPPGNGIDTHRMWEALYLGTIPVVARNPALEAFGDLPILFVNDLLSITPEFLEREYCRMADASWNTKRLFLPWWAARFSDARFRLLADTSTLTPARFLIECIRRRLRRTTCSPIFRLHESRNSTNIPRE